MKNRIIASILAAIMVLTSETDCMLVDAGEIQTESEVSNESTSEEELPNDREESGLFISEDNEENEVSNNNDGIHSSIPFYSSANINGVTIIVEADEGVFPDGTVLSTKKLDKVTANEVDSAVSEVRDDKSNVAMSYSFDISLIDSNGNEVEPDTSVGAVKMTFENELISNDNLTTEVYHVIDDEIIVAKKLEPIKTEESAVTVETDSFSYYTVEFTYGDLQYVMSGNSEINLSEILEHVNLSGIVTNVQISDENLITIEQRDSDWVIISRMPFSSKEWMKVVIDGVEYSITITDDTNVNLHNPVWSKDSEGNDVVTWDLVEFGNYWQNDTNNDGVADKDDNKEPIKWRVLSVDTGWGDVFLLADKVLDCEKLFDLTGCFFSCMS